MSTADIERPAGRFIQVVHVLPGRTRFRLSWLQAGTPPEEAQRLADELTGLAGVKEIEVNTRTGRVLCVHDPSRQDHAGILARLIELTGVESVVGAGERPPTPPPIPGDGPRWHARWRGCSSASTTGSSRSPTGSWTWER